jgi:hypothetical protein
VDEYSAIHFPVKVLDKNLPTNFSPIESMLISCSPRKNYNVWTNQSLPKEDAAAVVKEDDIDVDETKKSEV